jgi:putative intracellular protease/amidase
MNTTASGRRFTYAIFAMLVVAAAICAGATIWLAHGHTVAGSRLASAVQPVATSSGLPWG